MDGILIIDKPEGMTSHDVVSRVRRIVKTRRVGHAGTLDPFATGVLVVCIERATRLVQFLVGLDKEYIATVRLGFATDTQDLTGKQITPLQTSNRLSLEELRSLLGGFTGRQLQTPPMFSAKKVAGERLHVAARAGRDVERKPVEINVHSIELIESGNETILTNNDGTSDFRVRVRCSSGTYVRTLAHDIGARLHAGAHLRTLRRVSVGHLPIEDALTLDELEQAANDGQVEHMIISPADALRHLPSVELDRINADRARNGVEVRLDEDEISAIEDGADVRLLDETGALIGVGTICLRRASVKPRVVIRAAG